jgi:hypothetical protein
VNKSSSNYKGNYTPRRRTYCPEIKYIIAGTIINIYINAKKACPTNLKVLNLVLTLDEKGRTAVLVARQTLPSTEYVRYKKSISHPVPNDYLDQQSKLNFG